MAAASLDELFLSTTTNTWTNQNLSKLTSGESAVPPGLGAQPLVIGGPPLATWFVDASSQHIREYAFNSSLCPGSSWCDVDVTAASGSAAVAAAGTQITTVGVFSGSNLTVNVYYLSSNQHLYVLSCSSLSANGTCGGAWANQDLTGITGNQELAAVGAGLTTLTSTNQYVYFLDTNQHVRQYMLGPSVCPSWCDTDLTSASGATATAASGSSIYRLMDGSGGIMIFYIASDQFVALLYCLPTAVNNFCQSSAPGTWLNVRSFSGEHASPKAVRSVHDNTGYWFFFFDTNQHVRGYQYMSGATTSPASWHDNDLTALSAGPLASASSRMGYGDSATGAHLHYQDTHAHVHALILSGTTWSDQDATALAGSAPPPDPDTDFDTLFLTADGFHVFYIEEPPSSGADGPLPAWALLVLAAALLGVATLRLRPPPRAASG